MQTIFTSAYLPPIQYLTHWVNTSNPMIERYGNYAKRTYMNRCDILGANGLVSLTIPVIKSKEKKVLSKDVEIAYHERWQASHWRSIISAYGSSPFFEYYMDDFAVLYKKQYQFLLDFNNDLMQVVLDALDVDNSLFFTESYNETTNEISDYRTRIHPRKDFKIFDTQFKSLTYRQVFSDRFEFIPNLSVIDLLFNKGPEALDFLEDGLY